MRREPFLRVQGLQKRFGPGCADCLEITGPKFNTNRCRCCGTIVACHDVSFELEPDEALGIVGESGSGKSTVIRLLNFDWEPTRGHYFLHLPQNDKPCREITPPPNANLFDLSPFQKRQIRYAHIGVVYQHPHMGLRMEVSAGGNIAERLLMAGWRSVGAMRGRARELLERTEVPLDRMDDQPRQFSGGMQQRVQIAKAISNRPSLLLLDEVTTGLDVSVQARVLDMLRSLRSELGVAALVVSHDLRVIRMLTSRTLVMKQGRVVEAGLTDQILEDPQHPYTQLLVSSAL